MRRLKPIELEFECVEVDRPPETAREIHLKCETGGYYVAHTLKRLSGSYTLWLGDCYGEEPCFRVEHAFKTLREALYYGAWRMKE